MYCDFDKAETIQMNELLKNTLFIYLTHTGVGEHKQGEQ